METLCIGRGWDKVDQRGEGAALLVEEVLAHSFDPLQTLRAAVAASGGYEGLRKAFRKVAPRLDPSKTLDACVHVVGQSGGSGVLVSAEGLVLTAAHVVEHGDDPDDDGDGDEAAEAAVERVGRHVLLFTASGRVALSRCVACSEAGDAALLKVLDGGGDGPYPFAGLCPGDVAAGRRVVAVGNPFEFDLESERKGERIEFEPPVFHTSKGRVKKFLAGNRDELAAGGLGRLVHSAWTYWGHSGCPLFTLDTGLVAGVHNSWNDANGDRHGVPVSCVLGLLRTL